MMRRALVVAVHVAALAWVGRWAVFRVTEGGGEPWGLGAAALAVWIAVRRAATAGTGSATADAADVDLRPAAVLLALHAVLVVLVPPLFAAVAAVASLVALAAALQGRRRPDFALLVLAVLALPDASTLQVYVGWPFRVAVGATVAPLLGTWGLPAVRQGTMLVSGERIVAVDAPCSGVWMLWGGLVLASALAALRGLGTHRTLAVLVCVLPIVFAANVVRTACAFVAETSPAPVPPWAHEGIGILTFAAAAGAVLVTVTRLARRPACAA